MAQPVPLSAPLRGLNTLDPFIDFDSGFARELTNYAIVNGSIINRPSVRLVGTRTEATVTKINWYDPAANSGIERVGGDIVTLTTGATTGNIGGNCQENATTVKHLSLSLVIGCREPRQQVAPFTAWTFTTLSIVATAIGSACSHKGRLYVSDGNTIEYSDVAAITGAMKGQYTVNAFLDGQLVERMFSVTAQPGNNSNNVLVVFGSGGKVLVFTGAYPGSSDWDIVGNYNMPYPGSNTCFVETDGDIFVATEPYAYWFRDLFNSGAQTAYENSPTRPVQNLWGALLWRTFTGIEPANCFYFSDYDCIVCQCGQKNTAHLDLIANYGNQSAALVYFKQYKAWALWLMPPFNWPVIGTVALDNANSLVNLVTNIMVDKFTAGPAELFFEIETSWKSPYYFPQAGVNRLFAGVKPYFREFKQPNDAMTISLELIRAIFDLSDYNSPFGFYTQSMVFQINPKNFTYGTIIIPENSGFPPNIYTEYCGVGGNGAGVSIQFTQKGIQNIFNDQGIYLAALYFDEGAPYPA